MTVEILIVDDNADIRNILNHGYVCFGMFGKNQKDEEQLRNNDMLSIN